MTIYSGDDSSVIDLDRSEPKNIAWHGELVTEREYARRERLERAAEAEENFDAVYQVGIMHCMNKRYAEALPFFNKLIKVGDYRGMLAAAKIYCEGQFGVTGDFTEAESLLIKALPLAEKVAREGGRHAPRHVADIKDLLIFIEEEGRPKVSFIEALVSII